MQNSPQEIKLLQSCINDLTSLLALPAIWSGSDSSQIVITLLDAVVSVLRLDFAYARFLKNGSGSATEVLRLANPQTTSVLPQDVGLAFKDSLTDASATSPALIPNPIGEGEVFIAPLRLGLQDEIGFLVAASKRRDFPTRIETLLLQVAANQAVVGLQDAHLLNEQKRAAEELERGIADRTIQVSAVNAELVREIGVREGAEDELRKAKERVETIIESITDKFFAVDNEWRYTHFNKHAEEQLRLFGKNPASLIGKILWDEFPNHGSAEYLRRAMSEREVFTDEGYSPLLGEWYENRIYPNPDGGLAIFQRYVTQRKQAEQHLLKSEEKYRTLFDSIDEGFCTIEVLFDGNDKPVDYRFLEINPSFEKQTGIKDARGRTMREIAPQHEEHWFEIYGKIALTGEPARFENEAAQLHRWYDVYAYRVGPSQERKVAILFKDITKRKRAEEALRASEERFRRYFELGLIGMAITAPDKGCLEVNDELCRILGYERSELLQKNWAEMTHPDDLALDLENFERVLAGDMDGYTLDKRWIRKDGRFIDSIVAVQCVRRTDGAVDYFVGLVLDTTERKLTEEGLRKAQAELAHVARVTTLGELTASIAHEVNQPLAAIVTNGQASLRLLSRSKPDIDEAREAVESMIGDSLRASEVIKRIRALLKKTGPAKSALSVNEFIQDVINFTSSELKQNRVSLCTELGVDLPLVSGDRVQLQQVMLNLILNGREAMSSPGWQTRELLLRSEQTGPDWVQVTVKDTGIGLGSNDHERVFDAFFTRKKGGLGLGLSISRTIVEDHGGKLWAMPNEGLGASFQFRLPTAVENQ
jgi:PAS domain S-box-containing protein